MTELIADPLALLRTRTSTKWAVYPPDVLPMFVAEMDYPVAPEIAAKLVELVGRSDLGYDSRRPDLGIAFAAFAEDAWGWTFDPRSLKWTVNVMHAITEITRAVIEPGDRVLINTPVYPPFFWAVTESGGTLVDVPLRVDGPTQRGLDLEGIEAAFRDGVKVYLLCNPHNPIGFPHSRADLERVAELAAEHGVLVVADEIHGALTHADAEFVPYLAVSDAARATGVCVTSGSKAFNTPGLTCAWWVPGSPEVAARLQGLPESLVHRVSHLGTHASTVGFTESRQWLADAVETLEANRARLRELLGSQLPGAILHEPTASYLAWIDFRPLGWGDEPAKRIVREAKVALTPGVHFGDAGKGFARLNYACSPQVLEEGVRRIAAIG